MSKIIELEIKNNNLTVDCFVEKEEYSLFKERVVEQVLKNVTVKGFRKGHSPKDKAMEKVNPLELQSTIMQETIQRFFPDLQPEVDEEIKKQERSPLSTVVSISPDYTKEVEDGFQFRVIVSLLPKVELNKLSEITIKLPDGEDVPERISKKEFFEREQKVALSYFNRYEEIDQKSKEGFKITINLSEKSKSEEKPKTEDGVVVHLGTGQFPKDFDEKLIGLKKSDKKDFSVNIKDQELDYSIEVVKVEKPTLKTLEEIIENSEDAKSQIISKEDFLTKLESIYNNETSQIHNRMKKDLIIKDLLTIIPDFEMDDEKIESEIDRIFKALEEQALASKINIQEVFQISGLPSTGKKIASDDDVKTEIEDYVKKEFKLMNILQVVYFEKVEEKIKDTDVESLSKEIKADPKKYQIQPGENIEDLEKLNAIAYDRLLRSKAYTWIQDQVKVEILPLAKPSKK